VGEEHLDSALRCARPSQLEGLASDNLYVCLKLAQLACSEIRLSPSIRMCVFSLERNNTHAVFGTGLRVEQVLF
jgi:hypothetical protein